MGLRAETFWKTVPASTAAALKTLSNLARGENWTLGEDAAADGSGAPLRAGLLLEFIDVGGSRRQRGERGACRACVRACAAALSLCMRSGVCVCRFFAFGRQTAPEYRMAVDAVGHSALTHFLVRDGEAAVEALQRLRRLQGAALGGAAQRRCCVSVVPLKEVGSRQAALQTRSARWRQLQTQAASLRDRELALPLMEVTMTTMTTSLASLPLRREAAVPHVHVTSSLLRGASLCAVRGGEV